MVTFNLCGIMLLPLFCVVAVQIKRMAAKPGLRLLLPDGHRQRCDDLRTVRHLLRHRRIPAQP